MLFLDLNIKFWKHDGKLFKSSIFFCVRICLFVLSFLFFRRLSFFNNRELLCLFLITENFSNRSTFKCIIYWRVLKSFLTIDHIYDEMIETWHWNVGGVFDGFLLWRSRELVSLPKAICAFWNFQSFVTISGRT